MAGSGAAITNVTTDAHSPEANYTRPLIALTSLFFMWGFITCLNDILIPHLKTLFSLNYTMVMLIQFTFFTAYFIISLPSGIIVEKIGYKRGIVVGLIVTGIGCLMFIPAAGLRSYPVFLAALFVLASGITLLQVAANPYVAILGKPETASSRLNLTQAFNSLGTTVAPQFGTLLILSVAVKSAAELAEMDPARLAAYKIAEAHSVQGPYLLLASILFIIAVIFSLLKLPAIQAHSCRSEEGDGKSMDEIYKSAWHYRHLVLGAIAIFVYVGGEVAIGSFLVNYMKEINGLTEQVAGKYLSFYWGGAMVGRFIGSAVLQKIKPGKVLAFNAAVAALLVITTMLTRGSISMWTILSVGLFNSIMFPTIFTLAVADLGKHTSQGSGILCMAIVGGAIIPMIQGAVADSIGGIHYAFFIPLICYLYILFYGLKGYVPCYPRRA